MIQSTGMSICGSTGVSISVVVCASRSTERLYRSVCNVSDVVVGAGVSYAPAHVVRRVLRLGQEDNHALLYLNMSHHIYETRRTP